MIFLLLQLNTLMKDLDLNIASFTLHDKHPANSKIPTKAVGLWYSTLQTQRRAPAFFN
jgi:hypothetical protein